MEKKSIGIIGGGPAALFMFKRLVEAGEKDLSITIFERKEQLGAGMPYSHEGACNEHITNVSDNEIPELVTSIKDWLHYAQPEVLKPFDMYPEKFNEYKVVPRLLFGQYLADQFKLLVNKATKAGLQTKILYNTNVIDVLDDQDTKQVTVYTEGGDHLLFDAVVMCTGHNWPKKYEGKVPNWFDSPYPPAKLAQQINYPVAIKGSSLTAIDAVRTLARANGSFDQLEDGTTIYNLNKDTEGFRLVMHSIGALLPAIRFHLEDAQLAHGTLLTEDEMWKIMEENEGFIPLDYLFERNFKEPLRTQQPDFYEQVKDMKLEEFVDFVMEFRERLDPFILFKAEYAEAEKSIRRHQSIYWKEMLSALSYALNYPAKHLSAEDMLRHKKVLMPLISIIIAMVPQSSCRDLIALHDAGVLSLTAVDRNSKVEPAEEGCVYTYTDEAGKEHQTAYRMFVDAIGQPPFQFEDFPFKGLPGGGSISPAYLRFRSAEEGAKEQKEGNKDVQQDSTGNYHLKVPGISINDHFQVLDKYGVNNDRVYIMAVPYIAGLNPDYSGLDFCEAASERIIKILLPVKEPVTA